MLFTWLAPQVTDEDKLHTAAQPSLKALKHLAAAFTELAGHIQDINNHFAVRCQKNKKKIPSIGTLCDGLW